MSSTQPQPSRERESLAAKNQTWRAERKKNAAKLIGLGALGLVLPVIPGVLLLGGGLCLLFPNQAEKVWRRMKKKSRGEEKAAQHEGSPIK
jgi:hypothetical protein